MKTINELIDLIKLEKLSDQIFIGQNYLAPWKRVFGGQVIAQSLSAAYQTVDENRYAHSFHSYFLIVGDISIPIVYEVEKIRDGGSFSTRRVVAKQNGIAIFSGSFSFHKIVEGFEHQINMPKVSEPENCASDYDIINMFSDKLPAQFMEMVKTRPFEFRFTDYFNAEKKPYRNFWFKAIGNVSEETHINQQLLAYVSDYNLLTTAALPHIEGIAPINLFMASIDHAMWFHRKFKIDEWLLYSIDSPSSSNSRGFSRGLIYNRTGELVASAVQEGLISKLK